MNKKHLGRTAVLILNLIALLLAGWLLLSWPQPVQNDLVGVVIEVGQEEFARQYALGLLYEQEKKWEAAQEAYGKALLAEQSEIQQAADAGLHRGLASENSWLWAWHSTIIWLGRILFIANIFTLILIILALLRRRRKPQPGYLINPVQDFTKDGMGNGLHHLLALQLQSVRQAQANAVKMFRTQSLAAGLFPVLTPWEEISEEVANALSILEKVNIAGVDVSIWSFAQTVYRFWQKQEYTLTAQLHQRGNRLYLHIVLYHYLDHQPKLIWHLEGDPSVSLPDQKEALLREWIYRLIANQASPSLGTNSWRALEAYFDGLVLWQRYQEDGRFLADFLQQAAQKFQNAQNADPTFLATQFALGTIYNTQGHYEKAEIAFRNLVANDKDNLPLHYNLGVSYYHQVEKGRWAREKAVEQFLRIQNELEKQDTKNEYTDTLLALTYSSLAMICGLEMYDKNNPSEWVFDKTVERLEAVRIYTSKSQIAAQKIGDEKIKKIVLASSNHAMGFAYLQDKQFESARDFLERAIKEYPEYPVPYANLARACKNPDQAIVWLNRAVSIQPGFAYGWYQLGEIYYKTRATPDLRKKAWDAFIKAEGFADAQEKLGTMAFKDGNYESAMQYYYTAVRLNKHKEHIWRNMAWRTLQAIELDWISASQDVLQNALEWADQALHIARGTENEWRAHDVRGWALSLLALPDDALEAYDKSLKLNKNAQNLYHRAQVYVQTKNHIAAMVDLDEAKACANYKKWAMVIYTLQQEIGQLS